MRYLSVCSGIEAATAAWHVLGWKPAAFAEIEPFPCAVLAHHYPEVPNLGDMTKFKEWNLNGAIDLLVGGTPCQAFSVAGLRRGLEDARGNLTLTFCEIADHFDPEWVVWENVPGVLSSKDNAFGCFLAGLVGEDEPLDCGGKWPNAGVVSGPKRTAAWRVLDAQYFGVAQRRRRVFVCAVRGSGNWTSAAALFPVGESVFGDLAPSRGEGEGVAGGAAEGAGRRRWPADVASTLNAAFGDKQGLEDQHALNGAELFVPAVVGALTAKGPAGMGAPEVDAHHYVTHSLRGEGFDASEDGTGRGTPIVPVCFSSKDHGADAMTDLSPTLRAGGHAGSHANAGVPPAIAFHPTQDPISSTDGSTHAMGCGSKQGQASIAVAFYQGEEHASTQETNAGTLLRALRKAVGEEAFAKWGLGILDSLQSPEILRSALHGFELRPAAFSRSWLVYCSLSRQKDGSGWLLQSLRETGCEGCPPQGWQPSEQLARELGAYLSELSQPGAQAQRFMRDLWFAAEGPGLLRKALSAIQEVGRSSIGQAQSTHATMSVRRLTATECEFLQGFPRGYTDIKPKGKPTPDGPRYKALGNSKAVPVVRWIGRRIELAKRLMGGAE